MSRSTTRHTSSHAQRIYHPGETRMNESCPIYLLPRFHTLSHDPHIYHPGVIHIKTDMQEHFLGSYVIDRVLTTYLVR